MDRRMSEGMGRNKVKACQCTHNGITWLHKTLPALHRCMQKWFCCCSHTKTRGRTHNDRCNNQDNNRRGEELKIGMRLRNLGGEEMEELPVCRTGNHHYHRQLWTPISTAEQWIRFSPAIATRFITGRERKISLTISVGNMLVLRQ